MGNLPIKSSSSLPPLTTVPNCDTSKFMGTWFVIGNKPTFVEKTASNSVENYTWVQDKSYDIQIDYKQNVKEPITSKLKSLPQKGYIQSKDNDKSNSSVWKVSPFWPIKMPYLIIELDEEQYDYCVIGYPSRDYAWIMSRKPVMEDETYDMLLKKLKDDHQYDLEGLRKVPQKWTKEERAKRGLEEVISDDMLVKEEEEVKAEEAVKTDEGAKEEEPAKTEEGAKEEEPAKTEEGEKVEEETKAEEGANEEEGEKAEEEK